MREILFRGKEFETRHSCNGWVYGFYCSKGGAHFISTVGQYYSGKEYFSDVLVNPETVGQFTGILDKNGKKIFEGDVMFVTHLTPNPYWDYTSVIGVVQWTGGAFEVKGVENEDYIPYGWLHDSCRACREIIGNIHDNPELLR